MSEADHYATVPYGFEWGPFTVERLAGIRSGNQEIQVYTSEKGRTLRAEPPHERPA